MWVCVDGVETTLRAGDSIDIPAGSVHQMRNAGAVEAVVTWQTRPALRTGEFHREIAAARRSGEETAYSSVRARWAAWARCTSESALSGSRFSV